MKYTEDQYNEQVVNLKKEIEVWQLVMFSFETEWRKKMYENEEYKKILLKLKECENELETFKREHYSDFRVFTNTERYLSTRLDRKSIRREAALIY